MSCRFLRSTTLSPFGSYRSAGRYQRSEEHTSELQSQSNLVCRLLLEKKNKRKFGAPHCFMRNYCFAYLGMVLGVSRGGFATIAEGFGLLTLAQTLDVAQQSPVLASV